MNIRIIRLFFLEIIFFEWFGYGLKLYEGPKIEPKSKVPMVGPGPVSGPVRGKSV